MARRNQGDTRGKPLIRKYGANHMFLLSRYTEVRELLDSCGAIYDASKLGNGIVDSHFMGFSQLKRYYEELTLMTPWDKDILSEEYGRVVYYVFYDGRPSDEEWLKLIKNLEILVGTTATRSEENELDLRYFVKDSKKTPHQLGYSISTPNFLALKSHLGY